jgi:hypothetical protein
VIDAFGSEFCSGVLEVLLVRGGRKSESFGTLPMPGPAPKTMRARVMM